METPHISAEFIEDALSCLRSAGHDPAPLLQGLDVAKPVSAQTYGQLWWHIAQVMQDEFFGLGARPMRPGSFALMCQATVGATNLRQALQRALRFLTVVLDHPAGALTVQQGEAVITLTDTHPRSAFAYRTYWLILMGVACWLVGRRLPLKRLDFACPAPVDRSEYGQFFGAPVTFNADATRLVLDARHLTLPCIQNETSLSLFLRKAPANILIRFRHDQETAARVRQFLGDLAAEDWPDFDALAKSLKTSAATLRRRLKAEGQSYLAIKDDLRRTRARRMLEDPNQTVAQIAAALGYSEPSAFFRAYRKWTGTSPRKRV